MLIWRRYEQFYLPFVPGNSVESLLSSFGSFNENTIRVYIYQLLLAIAYMHSKNVIHRDIKGKNILVDAVGNLKVCDFGSAKQVAGLFQLFLSLLDARCEDIMGSEAPSITYNYTPLWTAPEVLQGSYDRYLSNLH